MITTYQIRNVLRVYGNQLKRRSTLINESVGPTQQPADLVDISIDARRRQMLSKMSNHLISKIVPEGDHERPEGEQVSDNPLQLIASGG